MQRRGVVSENRPLRYPGFVKILFAILLIVAMLLLVIPFPTAMGGMDGMGWCPACLSGNQGNMLSICLGILSSALVMLALWIVGRGSISRSVFNQQLLANSLLKPPRSVLGL